MKNLYLAQPNYRFGENAFLPYSVARLWAYCQSQPDIACSWNLAGLLPFRDPINDVISGMEKAPPDCLGLSVYIWNESYCLALARAVRAKYPECLIVMGGPQIPNTGDEWLTYADILVHGEGEQAMASILRGESPSGATTRAGRSGPNNRLPDLSEMPSPYLSGVLDDLVSDRSYNWHALQETNRGCPYQCTFCDWGSATFSKVREMPGDVILNEIEWFGKHDIELLYNCDANFGMLKRDLEIAEALVASKEKHGAPQKFRAAYAKKTTPRVYQAGKILADAGMSKGVTLSVQSMSPEVLKIVKRRAIDEPEFSDLVQRYEADGVPTYTEIIFGLPGETLDSFKEGVCRLFELGQHRGINIYPLIALKNSELSDPAYKENHGIKTVNVPMLLLHGTPDEMMERYDLIVETSTLSREEWIEGMLWAWLVQAYHCMGFIRPLAERSKSGYRKFYDAILARPGPCLQSILDNMRERLVGTIEGRDNWNQVDPRFGDVTWPPEEWLFMQSVLMEDLIHRQLGIGPEDAQLCRSGYLPPDSGDLKTWARETVWYARKGKKAA